MILEVKNPQKVVFKETMKETEKEATVKKWVMDSQEASLMFSKTWLRKRKVVFKKRQTKYSRTTLKLMLVSRIHCQDHKMLNKEYLN